MTLPSHTFLDTRGIQYERRSFPIDIEKGAASVARALGFRERQMVKTLIFETGQGERVLVMLGGDQNAVSGLLKKALGSRDVRMVRPEASIYAFFKVDGVTDTVQFCKDILTRAGVGLAPGEAFGPGGEGCVRLCFANSAPRLSEAMERLMPMLR